MTRNSSIYNNVNKYVIHTTNSNSGYFYNIRDLWAAYEPMKDSVIYIEIIQSENKSYNLNSDVLDEYFYLNNYGEKLFTR